jgi:DNA repair protein RadB
MVGGDILKYGSKCLIELQKVNSHRKAIIRKHRSIPEGKEIEFKIVDNGLDQIES